MIKHSDIAEKLNISRTTVARALNGSTHIKDDTKKRVIAMANKLGYEVNHVSSALASHHKKLVYVFLVNSEASKQYASDLQKGLEQFKQDSKSFNFELRIIHSPINEPDTQIELLKAKIKEKPKGIIIIPLNKTAIAEIIKQNLGITFISLGVSLEADDRYVGTNYYEMGRVLANVQEKFLNEDDSILLIETIGDNISSQSRQQGMTDYYNEQNRKIIGPYYFENIFNSIEKITEIVKTTQAKAIQSNRYISEMIQLLHERGINTSKIVTTGLTELTRTQLTQGIVGATVVEKTFQEGYLAASLMFDILIKKQTDKVFMQVGFNVIFKENLKYNQNN